MVTMSPPIVPRISFGKKKKGKKNSRLVLYQHLVTGEFSVGVFLFFFLEAHSNLLSFS